MYLASAFILGLVGSLHCLGMCGPIAVSLPAAGKTRSAYFGGRVLYNLGRVVTYGALGVVFGFVGQTIALAGWQRWLSMVIGILILASVVVGPGRLAKLSSLGVIQASLIKLRGSLSELMQRHGLPTLFGIGLLNGLLPCGLVYAALAGAAATGHAASGMVYMMVFGLGTFPVMLALALAGKPVHSGLRIAFQKAIPVCLVALGVLFILRGMALGIPYISPDLTVSGSSCCH